MMQSAVTLHTLLGSRPGYHKTEKVFFFFSFFFCFAFFRTFILTRGGRNLLIAFVHTTLLYRWQLPLNQRNLRYFNNLMTDGQSKIALN